MKACGPYRHTISWAIAAIPLAFCQVLSAGNSTQIAVVGDPSPDGNGTFWRFEDLPRVNSAGEVGFRARLTGAVGNPSFDYGLYRGTSEVLTQIARVGHPAPDANGTFAEINWNWPAFNGAGQIGFGVRLTDTKSGISEFASYIGAGGVPTLIARTGQEAPVGNGTFSPSPPVINEAGEAVILGVFSPPDPNTGAGDAAVYRWSGGTLEHVVRSNDASPDGNGTFDRLNYLPAINDSGQVAVYANLRDTVGVHDGSGMYLYSGNTLVTMHRGGQTAPNGNGQFRSAIANLLNNAGQFLGAGDLINTISGNTERGVFMLSPDGTVTEIARRTDPLPGNHDDTYFIINLTPVFNDNGQVAFRASINGTTAQSALLRTSDSNGGGLAVIARTGVASPDGNGIFSSVGSAAINNLGQLVFRANLSDTIGGTTDDHGLYFYDDALGLLTIARKNDPFLGSTLASFDFAQGIPGIEASGFNDFGQLAYRFTLSNGLQGVALWTIPEPSCLSLALILPLALLRLRRQHDS